MTRESALLGTPTYTVFLAELAAVDAELMRQGRLVDLRTGGFPDIAKKRVSSAGPTKARSEAIISIVVDCAERLGGARGG